MIYVDVCPLSSNQMSVKHTTHLGGPRQKPNRNQRMQKGLYNVPLENIIHSHCIAFICQVDICIFAIFMVSEDDVGRRYPFSTEGCIWIFWTICPWMD